MGFTDLYGEQSCTAGRSAFIIGQSVFRTGLSKVGIPGSPVGMRPEDPTIAGLLKARGYATGQFGKNHRGTGTRAPADEPRLRRFPPVPGALRPAASSTRGPTARDAADRRHRCADQEAHGDHRRRGRRGGDRRRPSPERSRHAVLLINSWPDAGMTPFRNEKNSNWEGAFRVPCVMRWPGNIPAGVVANDICSHLDMLPTLLSMAGEPDIKAKLLRGHEAMGRSYKVHLDRHDLVPFLTLEGERSPRLGYFYFSDDGDLVALRFDNWKRVPRHVRGVPTPPEGAPVHHRPSDGEAGGRDHERLSHPATRAGAVGAGPHVSRLEARRAHMSITPCSPGRRRRGPQRARPQARCSRSAQAAARARASVRAAAKRRSRSRRLHRCTGRPRRATTHRVR